MCQPRERERESVPAAWNVIVRAFALPPTPLSHHSQQSRSVLDVAPNCIHDKTWTTARGGCNTLTHCNDGSNKIGTWRIAYRRERDCRMVWWFPAVVVKWTTARWSFRVLRISVQTAQLYRTQPVLIQLRLRIILPQNSTKMLCPSISGNRVCGAGLVQSFSRRHWQRRRRQATARTAANSECGS